MKSGCACAIVSNSVLSNVKFPESSVTIGVPLSFLLIERPLILPKSSPSINEYAYPLTPGAVIIASPFCNDGCTDITLLLFCAKLIAVFHLKLSFSN